MQPIIIPFQSKQQPIRQDDQIARPLFFVGAAPVVPDGQPAGRCLGVLGFDLPREFVDQQVSEHGPLQDLQERELWERFLIQGIHAANFDFAAELVALFEDGNL